MSIHDSLNDVQRYLADVMTAFNGASTRLTCTNISFAVMDLSASPAALAAPHFTMLIDGVDGQRRWQKVATDPGDNSVDAVEMGTGLAAELEKLWPEAPPTSATPGNANDLPTP